MIRVPNIFKTIRGKITILFVAVFGITSIGFSVILYVLFARQTRENFDNSIVGIAAFVSETAIKEESHEGENPEEESHEGENLEEKIKKELAENPVPLTLGTQQFVEVFNRNGSLVAKSKGLGSETLPVSSGDLAKVLRGREIFRTISGEPGHRLWNSHGIRVLLYPETKNLIPKYIIAVGAPLSATENSLSRLRLIFFVAITLTLLFAATTGWFLAKRAFDPVNHIIATAKNLTANQLHRRLPVSAIDDELRNLSLTFNEMIERLERSFQTQKQFTSDASHELRTPLAILRGEMEVALQQRHSPEEYEETLRSGIEEIHRLQKISDDLLLLSQLESDKMPIPKGVIRLDELLVDAVQKMYHPAKVKGVSVVLTLGLADDDEEVEAFVNGDYSKLLNVVLNLLDNAIKYSSENGTVHCALTTTGEQATMTVADDGPGIPAEHTQHIFDRFYRANPSRTKNGSSGAGLGLAIVKAVVEAHDGTISVNSFPGKGTRMSVTLPLTQSPQ